MKNKYEIVESGTQIDLEDELGNIHSITVDKLSAIVYANGNNRNWKIIIDADDIGRIDKAVNGFWYVGVSKGTIYARYCIRGNGNRTYILMHRFLTDCPVNLVVDHHPHHYGLDNRRSNLSIVSALENSKNQIKRLR